MKKIFTLFVALLAVMAMMRAEAFVQVGDLFYSLDLENKTAMVTGITDGFTGKLVIPSTIEVNKEELEENTPQPPIGGDVPEVASPAAGYVTFVIQIPEGSECNGIAFKGSIDGMSWTAADRYLGENGPAALDASIRFEAIDGSKEWFKATYKLGETDFFDDRVRLAGKLCLIYTNDGSWEGQASEWEYIEEYCTADCSISNDGNIQIHSSGLCYIKVGGWYRSECRVPEMADRHIVLVVPRDDCGFEVPTVVGSFNSWNPTEYPMTLVEGRTYEITINVDAIEVFKFAGSVSGWDARPMFHNSEEDTFIDLPNTRFGSDTEFYYDFSNGRWSSCDLDDVSPRKQKQLDPVEPEMVTFNVTAVDAYFGYGDCEITSVEIPSSVLYVIPYAFEGASALKHISAPAHCFNDARVYGLQLESVVVNSGELSSGWGAIDDSRTTLQSIDLAGTSNTELTEERLLDFYTLQSLKLPSGLTRIGYKAVAECVKLKAIDIPASVTEIDDRAFEDCRSLAKITFSGKELRRIGSWAFYNAHALQKLSLPEGVEEIGDGAFYGCTYLEDLTLPSSVRAIGDNGFSLCGKIRKMVVGAAEPPAVEDKTFFEVSQQAPVYVPDESVDNYLATPVWRDLNIQKMSKMPDAVDYITTTAAPEKLIVDGQLLILRDGKIYSAQGQQLK